MYGSGRVESAMQQEDTNVGRRGVMKNSWVQTYTGRRFFPLDPDKNEICIEDIANALGKICRYNGHTSKFYSVAEHSVYVSQNVSEKNAMWGLLHDAAEAYLGDVVSPIKPFLNGYREYEENLMACIAEKFDLCWPMPKEVKQADVAIIGDESFQVMGLKPTTWSQTILPPLGIEIVGLDWEASTELFLKRYDEIAKTKA